MNNSIGDLFTITCFGESHGDCVGVVIDGCPAGLPVVEEDIQKEVDKRKPGKSAGSTRRIEEDKVEIVSGVFEGHSTGAPICMVIRNKDTDSSYYKENRYLLRPGHADYTAYVKYGGFNDYRGGGRFSGRITASMVMAGAVAKELLTIKDIEIMAYTTEIGGVKAEQKRIEEIKKNVGKNPLRCADLIAAEMMIGAIEEAWQEKDSLGGVIEGIALNVPVGLGEPVFDTLEGELAKALFAIPAVKGVEFGSGFSVSDKRGSENNDQFTVKDKGIETLTNNAGGILGGISSGMPILVRVAIKPTPSIGKKQKTVDIKSLKNTNIEIKGRHDVCLVPRAVPVVEAMMAVTLCDFSLKAGLIPRIIK